MIVCLHLPEQAVTLPLIITLLHELALVLDDAKFVFLAPVKIARVL